nr:MAG: DNA pilot protein [Microvirus sp.]
MIPALIAGGASVLGGLFGGLFGKKNNNSTNRTNMQIAQMNNDFNAAEAQKSRDFQLDMWNKTNAYNDPSAQRERLAAAGLNPALMMDGGSAGQASSSVSSPAASSAGNPTMQPYDWSTMTGAMAQSIIGSLQLSNETKLADANVTSLQGQRSLAEAQALRELSNVDWSKMSKETREYMLNTGRRRAELGMAREQQELNNLEHQGLLLQAQRMNSYLSAESQATLNKYLDDQQKQDLMVKAASAYASVRAGQASMASVRKMLAEEIESSARTQGMRLSTYVAKRTAETLIQATNFQNESNAAYYRSFKSHAKNTATNDAWSRYWDTKTKAREYKSMPWKVGSSVVGNAVGAARAVIGR